MKNTKYKSFSIVLIAIGALSLLSFIIILITSWLTIDYDKIDSIGSFLSGLLGPIWALAGIFLIFQALREQQVSNKISQDAFILKIKEAKDNIVFLSKQVNLLEIQQFESSFRNLVDILLSIESNAEMDNHFKGKRKELFKFIIHNVTNKFYDKLIAEIKDLLESDQYDLYNVTEFIVSELTPKQLIIEFQKLTQLHLRDTFIRLVNEEAQSFPVLNDYMAYLNRLLSFIIENSIDKNNKIESIKTLMSLLSKEQIQLIYYWDTINYEMDFDDSIIEINDANDASIFIKARDLGLFKHLSYEELPEFSIFKKFLDWEDLSLLSHINRIASSAINLSESQETRLEIGMNQFLSCILKNKILYFNIIINKTYSPAEQCFITIFFNNVTLFHYDSSGSFDLLKKNESIKRKRLQLITYTFQELTIDHDNKSIHHSFDGLYKDDSGAVHRINERAEEIKLSNKFTKISFEYSYDNTSYNE